MKKRNQQLAKQHEFPTNAPFSPCIDWKKQEVACSEVFINKTVMQAYPVSDCKT